MGELSEYRSVSFGGSPRGREIRLDVLAVGREEDAQFCFDGEDLIAGRQVESVDHLLWQRRSN
jgi:hypothetical protein